MARIDSAGAIRKTESTERRAKINEYIILAVLFFFVAVYIGQWWRLNQALKIDRIEATNVRVIGPAAICPGEELVIRYDLVVQGFGIIIEDGATYANGQPITYSQAQRIPGDGPAQLTLSHRWKVPERPDMMVQGSQEWLPGSYARLITLAASTSWVSRFVDPQRFTVAFEIREGCD